MDSYPIFIDANNVTEKKKCILVISMELRTHSEIPEFFGIIIAYWFNCALVQLHFLFWLIFAVFTTFLDRFGMNANASQNSKNF